MLLRYNDLTSIGSLIASIITENNALLCLMIVSDVAFVNRSPGNVLRKYFLNDLQNLHENNNTGSFL